MSQRPVMPVQDYRVPIRYNEVTVTTETFYPSPNSVELHEVCVKLQSMGYAQSKRIRIYGQEFEAVSNPFPSGNGIAIQALAQRETQARTLRLPLPIVQMVTRQKHKKNAA
jgi:hypothetical protein